MLSNEGTPRTHNPSVTGSNPVCPIEQRPRVQVAGSDLCPAAPELRKQLSRFRECPSHIEALFIFLSDSFEFGVGDLSPLS